ncbi:hypothetical protein H5410_041240 [Solanum commersonii]|uniref:Uncharacterized protein n=1 Tax=Solanum commersonii TaxID=4109 RepID=A0A9J5XUX0_SOLCO|nr:hypothetical protein H5410_041240 [Solanum commersonii]
MEKSKLDVLQQKMHDLEKKMNGGLNFKPAHDLRYEKLCLHPRVELPPGFKILKFNMFDGNGDPVAHLKDFCSRLVGLENNEPLLMRLFIQSSSGISLHLELEYDIQFGRIIDEQIHFKVLKNTLDEKRKNASTFVPPKQNNQNTEQLHAIFDSSVIRFKPYNPQVSQLKDRGLLKPREGWIPKHPSSTLDLSKNCAYHSNIQGQDTEEFPALRNKIQNMIENRKIIVQQGPLNNNCNPASMYAVIVQGDPTKIYSRPFTRKHKSHQRN